MAYNFGIKERNLITVVPHLLNFVIRYDFVRNIYVFEHDEIKHGEPEYVTGEAIEWMQERDEFNTNVETWMRGVSWEDIVV